MVVSVNAHTPVLLMLTRQDPTCPYTKLPGEDSDPKEGSPLAWRYHNEPLTGHLSMQASNPLAPR